MYDLSGIHRILFHFFPPQYYPYIYIWALGVEGLEFIDFNVQLKTDQFHQETCPHFTYNRC